LTVLGSGNPTAGPYYRGDDGVGGKGVVERGFGTDTILEEDDGCFGRDDGFELVGEGWLGVKKSLVRA
jgi:hypothetical protein